MYKVKEYESFIECYPGSFEIKKVHVAGAMVDIKDISTCKQAFKLEQCTEADEKKAAQKSEPKKPDAPAKETTGKEITGKETEHDPQGSGAPDIEAAKEAARAKLMGK